MATHANTTLNNVLQAPAIGGSFPETDLARAFEEWSAATIATTGNLPDPQGDLAHSRYTLICNCDANTPGDAAIKLCVILHSLYVSDAKSMFPQQCAALSTVVADLERQEAAARFARRTDAGPQFVNAWRAFSGYDEAVKALPGDATEAEIDLADDNRFDALADLMNTTPQTASEAAALLRVIVAQQPDFLGGSTPIEQAILAGLGNVLAALERLATGVGGRA